MTTTFECLSRRVGRQLSISKAARRCRMTFHLAYALAVMILAALPGYAQRERGELWLQVLDPKGAPLVANVILASEASSVHQTLSTSQNGRAVLHELPFGVYRLRLSHQGFAPSERLVEIRSEVPVRVSVKLGLATLRSSVNVTDASTLVDPERAGTIESIGSQAVSDEVPAQVGRTLSDLVDSQPGWLYEANGVLHPRGSEYDVQYVVNDLPFTENRSPAFAPPFQAEDVQEMQVLTAGFPAEYGRKLGGVVEITAQKDLTPGLHLTTDAVGGSFATADGDADVGYARGPNQFMLTGNAASTGRYLDPPVTANYTNHGSTGSLAGTYIRDLSDHDRLRLSISRSEVRYLVPNELVQQQVGQRQDTADVETSGQVEYERVFSPNLLLRAEGSLRDQSFRLWSNDLATPVIISQQRGFRQGYGHVTLAGHHGAHDWEAGADTIISPVHEALQYQITDAALFDPGTALRFNFLDRRSDIEPAAFAQDKFHWRNWNLSYGLRFDHYRFVVNQSAWSPRLAVSRYFPSAQLMIHASYDRVFQTPATENLLLASSPAVSEISNLVLRLPVEPARANYYEAGLTKAAWGKLRLDVNIFRRDFRNFSDDDTLLDTGVSFPIADAAARIQGAEAKIGMPSWGRFSSFISYTNQEGIGEGPITGGLFIGSEAIGGVPDNSRFWISQDQRNTARAHLRYQASKRLWLAMEHSYGSGLPVELDTGDINYNFLLSQYGPQVLNEVNFAHGRVRPNYSLDASAGFDLYSKENKTVNLQAESSNLTNHFNVINFASLFSGTALGIPRSFDVRLKLSF